MVASKVFSLMATSRSCNSICFSWRAKLASAVLISSNLRCSSAWISFAASAIACLVSTSFWSSALLMSNSFCFNAIWVLASIWAASDSCAAWASTIAFSLAALARAFAISNSDLTLASLDSLAAWACAIAISFSALARETAASLEIFTMLSTPRFSITWLSSMKFWTLNDTISRPIPAKSGDAFCLTISANFWRSETISSNFIWPTISRILPSSTSLATCAIYSGGWFKKFCAASFNLSVSSETFTFTTASTLMFM